MLLFYTRNPQRAIKSRRAKQNLLRVTFCGQFSAILYNKFNCMEREELGHAGMLYDMASKM